MWVITGPFDGEVTGEVGFEKSKLLKPSTTYALGRKDKDLIVNSKKISQNHCDFIVGEHTVDQVDDYNFKPTLEILNRNNKDKSYQITRNEQQTINVNPSEKVLMESGDSIVLVSGTIVKVEWRPICVFYPPSRSKSSVSSTILNGCASLGIKLSQKMHENITHHLAAHYVANLTMAASLLNLTRFVKPEWLNEILRLAALPRNDENATGTSLEDNFILPLETKFRPSFSPSLLPKQKTFDVWEPNEERVNFFKPFRFICMQEKATEMESDIREAIDRGGGSFETFNITEGLPKFHRVLSRSQAKEGKKTIVVGDIDSLQTAVGNLGWTKFVSEARSYSTDIFAPAKIIQSVIEIDASLLEVTTADSPPRSSPLPDKVPNSIPEEPSMQPDAASPPKRLLGRWASRRNREPTVVPEPESPPRRRPLRRVTTPSPEPESPPRRRPLRRVTTPSPERSVPPEPENPPRRALVRRRFGRSCEPSADVPEPPSPPRRVPTRRVGLEGRPIITGLEDPSSIIDSDTSTSMKKKTPPPTRRGYAAFLDMDDDDEDAERHKRLKRRMAAMNEPESTTMGTTGIAETLPEPPLKKFKALFEASNPTADALAHFTEALADPDLDVEAIVNSQTQTQTDTQGLGKGGRSARGMGVSSLAILREEEEETQARPAPRDLQGTKRPRLDSVDESVGMEIDAGSSRSRASSSAGVGASAGASAAKRRAVENVNAVQRTTSEAPAAGAPKTAVGATNKPPSTFNSREEKGKAKEREKEKDKQIPTATSKPDTDDAFLKAIASTKRGKKTEDEFDREFNKLKIRKPGLDEGRRDPEEEWAVLKDFEDDTDVRGNFMVIVDLEPYKKDPVAIEAARQRHSNPAWDGLPNFKKFKQKAPSAPRPKIELFVSQDNDYGMGPSYWKSGNSQHTQGYTQMDTQYDMDSQHPKSRKADKSQLIDDFEDEDDGFSTGRRSRKPPSKAESGASSSRRMTTSKAKAPAKNALFLDSDEDIQEIDEQSVAQGSRARSSRYTQDDSDFDLDQTLQSSAEMKRKAKAKAPVGSRRTTTRTAKGPTKHAPAPVMMDDDSDDAVFKGFSGRKKVGR